MKVFYSINPYDGTVLGEHAVMNLAAVDHRLERAEGAWPVWSQITAEERSSYFVRLAQLLEVHKEELVQLMAREMGKAVQEGHAEIEKCARTARFYAEHGPGMLQNELVPTEARRSFITFQPLGAILGIMPWNYPFWQVMRAALPALMAGNLFFLKHAPNVCLCSRRLEQLFAEAGFPEGVFQSFIIDLDMIDYLVGHRLVQGITLTGSERAGASAAALAGKHIKKSVLELGGSDPFLVLADANIAHAAQLAVTSRMQNAGQSCIAAKRWIVHRQVHDAFLEEVLKILSTIKQGDPLQVDTTMGPMARLDLAEHLEQQQQASIAGGCRLVGGGVRQGCNYAPTVLDQVPPSTPAFEEELFGPVAAVVVANDDAHMVALANQSRYGLGATICTGDPERGEELALRLQCGAVYINSLMRSDPRFPFGGIKKSGYGRELGRAGILEFTNMKTIYIA